MKIKIKYHANLPKLKHVEKGNWIDLRSAEDIVLKPFEYKLISLGVSMELPEGYEALVVPRSSTFKNFGIIQVNHCGVIDSTYCGDTDIWKFGALAFRNTVINFGDRICQFRIQPVQQQIEFDEVNFLMAEARGGIGSTGVK